MEKMSITVRYRISIIHDQLLSVTSDAPITCVERLEEGQKTINMRVNSIVQDVCIYVRVVSD
jgi:uncharacterized protein (UPF0335 family)